MEIATKMKKIFTQNNTGESFYSYFKRNIFRFLQTENAYMQNEIVFQIGGIQLKMGKKVMNYMGKYF